MSIARPATRRPWSAPRDRQLILVTNLVATTVDAPSFAATMLGVKQTFGLPKTVLADTGFASAPLWRRCRPRRSSRWLPSAAHNRTGLTTFVHRPRPRPSGASQNHGRVEMKVKLETEDGKNRYKQRKQTVGPVFGIIKAAIGFVRFHLRGLGNVANEWRLIALTYNCRRLARLRAA